MLAKYFFIANHLILTVEVIYLLVDLLQLKNKKSCCKNMQAN